MTELDRIFRHFRARDFINHGAAAGAKDNLLLLDPSDRWIGPNFQTGTYKNNRRLLFFPDAAGAPKSWITLASEDSDPFEDEDHRAEQARADKSKKAKERRALMPAKKGQSPPDLRYFGPRK